MIRCFGRSRAVLALGVAGTAVLAVLAGAQRAGYPLWVLCITVALVPVLGVSLSVMLAGMAASHCNQKLLAILHIQLRPKEFLSAYARVPGRAAPKSTGRVITSAYLADGYCAAGQPQKALETLVWDFDAEKRGSRLPLQGLLLHNQCRYFLHCGDAAGAGGAADKLQELIERLEKENPALALNLGGQLKLYRVWIDVLNGTSADEQYLQEELKQSSTKIARLELYWLLALNCGQRSQESRVGNDEAANPQPRLEYLQKIVDEGGETALASRARAAVESEKLKV